MPQKAPETAPAAVSDVAWCNFVLPSGSLVTTTASSIWIRYCFCILTSAARISNAVDSSSNTTATRVAMLHFLSFRPWSLELSVDHLAFQAYSCIADTVITNSRCEKIRRECGSRGRRAPQHHRAHRN